MTIKLNTKNKNVNQILLKLKDNDFYCLCALIKDEDHKCMCKDFQQMESGVCHCGLWIKEKN